MINRAIYSYTKVSILLILGLYMISACNQSIAPRGLAVNQESTSKYDTEPTDCETKLEKASNRISSLEDTVLLLQDSLLSIQKEFDKGGKAKDTIVNNQELRNTSENEQNKELTKSNDANVPTIPSGGRNFTSPITNTENTLYIVDIKKAQFGLFLANAKGQKYRNIGTLKADLARQKQELIFGMNAGMYTPTGDPEGLYIVEGKELFPIDMEPMPKDKFLNFYMEPNGVFLITSKEEAKIVRRQDYKFSKGEVKYATQSGPMLLINGAINSYFNENSKNKKIRNGIGVMEDGRLVCIISNEPITFYNFAILFKELGCKNALYLDGVISKMYVPSIGRMDLSGNLGPIIGIIR